MTSIIRNKNGMALLSVVLLSALLITLYLRYMDEAGLQARIDAGQEQILQARWAALGGVEFAMSLLYSDRNPTDSYEELWAKRSEETFENPLFIGQASCAVKIIDESGKANINLAKEEFLVALFNYYDFALNASGTIFGEDIKIGGARRLAHHILDYIDEDDSPRAMGAEIEDYNLRDIAGPRNGALQDIRELYNIPGITKSMMVASGTRPGLGDLFTVFGDGWINLNSAPKGLIRAVPGLPEDYSYARREEYYENLFRSIPFQELAGYTNYVVGFDWHISKDYTKKFVIFTSWFRIEAHAQIGKTHRWATAIVKRERNGDSRIVRLVEVP